MARTQITPQYPDNEQFERTSAWIRDSIERASALRAKDREFHALEREFGYLRDPAPG
jgi:hypothetical protein